jgi:sugar O-acyltransferase (sialic acid O-acetyltransferase NeuD family)
VIATGLSLILIGAGGHAQACIDVIEQQQKFQIAGIVGTGAEIGQEHFGYRVIASDEAMASLRGDHTHAVVAVGQIKSPDLRMKLFALARGLCFELPAIVSPSAYVSRHATLGAGSIVMHGAIVNAGAQVGENCIINTRALVEHGAMVGDHCHISTGAIINGGVRIGAGSFVGSGSVLKEGVCLGDRCLVGMGVCLRRDHAAGTRVIA